MTPERLEAIKLEVDFQRETAEEILKGGENYDGADGARYLLKLSKMCGELISELEQQLESQKDPCQTQTKT